MSSLWQTTSNGQTPLTDGQVVYVVEGYFQTPSLSLGSCYEQRRLMHDLSFKELK